MRKVYAKPLLYAESFELVEHIAGDCVTGDSFAGALHRGGKCGYDIGSVVVFTEGLSDCNNADFNSMVEFADFKLAGLTQLQIAEKLNLECYNSMYSFATSFFAS